MRFFWLCAALSLFCLAPPPRAEQPKKDEIKKTEGKTFLVPYKLTEVKHVLIRAKINGKGPFNFILDTGAPALFVSTALAKKLGVEPDDKGWGTFDKFEIEGGVSIPKAKGRIEDPFQLDGMNSLGLIGVELHGMIGYNILARYKLEFDFTKDKMGWTELDFVPVEPKGLGGKGGSADMDAMAGMVKLVTAFLGKKTPPEPIGRGFLGVEWKDDKDAVEVKAVLADSPAAKAGVKAGDRISKVKGKSVSSIEEMRKAAAELKAGDALTLTVERAGKTEEITVKAGEGL
jgi:serine protease DegQ